MPKKIRLDVLCVEKGLAPSREKAQALIMAGQILLDGEVVHKAGQMVPTLATIDRKGPALRYVSRGGLKLEAALDHFQIAPQDFVALDIGASTGGFTDCLLQRGARHVFSVDVGHGQLDARLRGDPRVTAIEHCNIRYATRATLFPPDIVPGIVTIDVSFISLKLVLPVAVELVDAGTAILALVKPQFEAGPKDVGKGGVVRDTAVRERVIDHIKVWCSEHNLAVEDELECPVHGPKGNIEHWLLLRRL